MRLVSESEAGVGQEGRGERSDFRNWTGARSAKEKMGRSAERQFFSNFPNIFPIPHNFHGRFLKEKKKERWKPTGALSADRKCVGARSANAKKGRSVEQK